MNRYAVQMVEGTFVPSTDGGQDFRHWWLENEGCWLEDLGRCDVTMISPLRLSFSQSSVEMTNEILVSQMVEGTKYLLRDGWGERAGALVLDGMYSVRTGGDGGMCSCMGD